MLDISNNGKPKERVIVIIQDIDLRALTALRYAKTVSDDITVFCAVTNEADADSLQSHWEKLGTGIPLELNCRADGATVEPLLEFIRSDTFACQPDELITVLLPRLVVTKWWHRLLHNQDNRAIERGLSGMEQINVVVLPVRLQED
jgi:hypothetical protein